MKNSRAEKDFFEQDVLDVSPQLLGNYLVIHTCSINNKYLIKEVEAYRGEEDLACHASKGKTKRNEIMYSSGGAIYVYLIYGMYWMLNFVTGKENDPQAVLIRKIQGMDGPGIITRELKIDKSFYGEKLYDSKRIWIEYSLKKHKYYQDRRIGIDYAGDYWKNQPWRYILEES